jgi:hypothetical protein
MTAYNFKAGKGGTKPWRLYRIEGESLTTDQIRARLPPEAHPPMKHRLSTGTNTWAALSRPAQPGRRLK